MIVMGADVKRGNWQVSDAENWITDRNPGFVNARKGDFRLKPNSEVFERLPGFKPIPFQKMGLYADELRPNPPKEPWPYSPPKPLPPLSLPPAATPPPAPPVSFAAGMMVTPSFSTGLP